MAGDVIELRGLRLSARCGVLPEERERDQPLELDLDLVLVDARAGSSDDLDDTVDYGEVCNLVAKLCAQHSPQLLEHLAELIATEVLATTTCDAVTIVIRKLRPPVPQQLVTAGVRITRQRTPR